MAVSVDVVDELVQHHGRQSGHAGEETIGPRRRGQPGERRREVVTIGGPQRLRGAPPPRCALLVAVGGAPHSCRDKRSCSSARRPHGARRGGDFSAVADPRLVFGSGAGLVHTPCDLAVNCCSPGSTNSDSDTRPPRRPPRCSAHVPLPSPAVQAHDHRPWRVTCPPGTGRHRTARSTTARSSHRTHPRTASVYHRCWCRSRHHRPGRGCRTTGRRTR